MPCSTCLYITVTCRLSGNPVCLCSCLFEAQKPFGPFLDALVGGSDFGTAPSDVATAAGTAAPPATFSPDPEPGQYDDEDDYRCPPSPPYTQKQEMALLTDDFSV